jgi:hypothetical protein
LQPLKPIKITNCDEQNATQGQPPNIAMLLSLYMHPCSRRIETNPPEPSRLHGMSHSESNTKQKKKHGWSYQWVLLDRNHHYLRMFLIFIERNVYH